ncbi:MAG: TlpA disulfide reductase family protein [Actinomycetota bacterium]|nr:TlpA disulfide reductase family protein [Actinomycetota bacterium]
MHRFVRPFICVLIAGGAVLSLNACGGSEAAEPAGADSGYVAGDGSIVVLPEAGRLPAPSLAGTTLTGGSFDLAQAKGEVVVLNVWASWCAPCRAEAADLEATWASFADDDVQFVGLNTRDSPRSAEAFVKRFKITYPSVVDTDGQLQLLFRDTLPPQAIPSTLLVDKQGRVAARALGIVSESSLRALIEPLLAEQP